MPNDYVTLNALCRELNDALRGAKIDKIYMPEEDEITLAVRSGGVNRALAISANAQNPRVHFTSRKKQNPVNAPSFCMLLRKFLTGAVVDGCRMLGEDRIFCFDITARNELRDAVKFLLVAEMMGRYSNIMLIDGATMTVKDALKQASFDTATKRCLLPGAKYELPPQNKLKPTDRDAVKAHILAFDGGKLADHILSAIGGFARQTAEEAIYLAGADGAKTALDDAAADRLTETLAKLANVYDTSLFSPCVSVKNGVSDDFFVFPYATMGAEFRRADSLSDAVDACVGERDAIERKRLHARHLVKACRALTSKTRKKLEKCIARKQDAEGAERNRIFGELLMSSLHSIERGSKSARVPDYYEEGCPLVDIPLDPALSPQQNAAQYFKKYAKQKRTSKLIDDQIAECKDMLEYLRGVEVSINACESAEDIAELERELEEAGAPGMRKAAKGARKPKPTAPLLYDIDGFTVAAGKNNTQNEKLTFKTANGNDIWLHAKDSHGSHVIIFAEGETVPETVIAKAAAIAAHYSEAGTSDKAVVDYTARKNVKRHPCGKPGMVLYTVYNSVAVKPDAMTALELKR